MADAYIWIDPARCGGEPCINGTRIPPECVASYYLAGDSADALCRMYGISRQQFLVACWFLAVHGSPRWRRRWQPWAARAGQLLWSRETADQAPDPPR